MTRLEHAVWTKDGPRRRGQFDGVVPAQNPVVEREGRERVADL
jgi:hypothetical protein